MQQRTHAFYRVGLGLVVFTLFAGTRPASFYHIVIDKSAHTITLRDADDWLVEWPCTFGSDDKRDKMFQGDRRTPEGRFTIVQKRPHAKWRKFMLLDYPTPSDYAKFNDRKQHGTIPSHARIGGGIGIHGTWPHEDWAVERLQNWTEGCIAMKNEHVDELYNLIETGTVVFIKP